MTTDDNSVNINARRRYHHGDLRAALLSAGLELLRERTADEISLREVARRVGVSPTAVYRHFPDKNALLYAMCETGAELLAAAQREAADNVALIGGDQRERFDAMGQAYVRFALANPALFRLMMGTHPGHDYLRSDATAVNVAMRLLRDTVASFLPPDAGDEARMTMAVHAWSLVHGMAMLMLDGQIPADESLIATIRRPFRSGAEA